MLTKSTFIKERAITIKSITAGAITGGIFSLLVFNPSIEGGIIGVIIGGCLGSLAGLYINHNTPKKHISSKSAVKLPILEEQLDISKRSIKTGEVTVHKEVFTEERNITVPVSCEELVIEKKILNDDTHTKADMRSEILRIPLRTEKITVIKNPVTLEDVEVYNHQLKELHSIQAKLKKVNINVKANGNKVLNIDSSSPKKDEN